MPELPEDQKRRYDELLAAASAAGDDAKPAVIVSSNDDDLSAKISFARYLNEQYEGAVLSGNKEKIARLGGMLSNVGAQVGAAAGVADSVSDVGQAERRDLVVASTQAQTAVTNAVAANMNQDSKKFFNSLKQKSNFDSLAVNRDGSFDPSKLSKVDAKELQDAFANLELGGMDPDKRKGVIEQIQKTLGIDSHLSDEERTRALIPAMHKMEQYKAAKILLDGRANGESMESIATKIKENHKEFEKAEAQVGKIIRMKQGMSASADVDDNLRGSGNLALDFENKALRANLEKIRGILLDKTSGNLALSGGINPTGDLVSGLVADAKAAITGNSGSYIS